MLDVTTILALFILLLISSAAFFIAPKVKLPYTVLLVLVGLLLVPLTNLPVLDNTFGFLRGVVLTPELLFYVFLPMLIFESAFNMNFRKMVENIWHISLLSVIGLLISASIIATLIFFTFQVIGLPVPFVIALLFGAVISATDPVAVLALFKEFGAPKRLTLIFEGESLFNDGTAVALFMVILAVAISGFDGPSTIIAGINTFVMMVALGILFGVFMATLFSKALRYTRSNEFVSITLLIVSAHLVFILSELINENPIFGVQIHVSAIIATTVSSLFLGTYARHILSPASDGYLKKSIEHLAFVANSLVFLLAGILFASTQINLELLWLPILLTILIVMIARAISVYAVTLPLNAFRPVSRIPGSWQTLLAWGSLRGALAIIIVLLIPENFTIAGWPYDFTPRELLIALTVGCILATLFIKTPTIGKLVKKFGVDKLSPLSEARLADLGVYYLQTESERIKELHMRGYVDQTHYQVLHDSLEAKIAQTQATRDNLREHHGKKLFTQALHYEAISIEEKYLKKLYVQKEVNESVYRRIKGKLSLQQEKIEYAQHESIDPHSYTDRKDVFDRLVAFSQNPFAKKKPGDVLENKYQYYRAQAIIARKVSKVLHEMQQQFPREVFYSDIFETVINIYENHQAITSAKAERLLENHPKELEDIVTELSIKSLHTTGDKAVKYFEYRGIVGEEMAALLERRYAPDSIRP